MTEELTGAEHAASKITFSVIFNHFLSHHPLTPLSWQGYVFYLTPKTLWGREWVMLEYEGKVVRVIDHEVLRSTMLREIRQRADEYKQASSNKGKLTLK